MYEKWNRKNKRKTVGGDDKTFTSLYSSRTPKCDHEINKIVRTNNKITYKIALKIIIFVQILF